MVEQQQLIWNNDRNHYYAELEDGRTLYVSGDAWAEARYEMARTFFAELHPEMEQDALYELYSETVNADGSEADECDTRAWNELIDPSAWEADAVEVDDEGFPLDPKMAGFHFDAWIRKEAE
jgi:hypothetical protein